MTSEEDPFTGAGVTALGLAASRTVESTRVDRLIDDPLARTLFEAGAAAAELPMRLRWPRDEEDVTDTEALHLHGSRYIGLRTRFYDDALLNAMSRGIRQAVLLGAGLDTRALRLALPAELHVYELDRPAVLDFKASTLAEHGIRAHCGLTRIGTDLSKGWATALESAGLRSGEPAIWIAEGLLPYLSGDGQAAVIEAIDALSAPSSALAFDQIGGGDVRALSQRSGLDMEELLLSTGGHDALMADLRSRGWTAAAVTTEAVAARYGRDLTDPFGRGIPSADAPPWLETSFVTADKRAGSR